MTKPSKDFLAFQKEFLYWQQKMGCTGYKCYFKHEPLENSFARIKINSEEMVATVSLHNGPEEKEHKNVKRSAKHEAIHLMLSRLEDVAGRRHIRAGEIYESVEELVFKLEKLIWTTTNEYSSKKRPCHFFIAVWTPTGTCFILINIL